MYINDILLKLIESQNLCKYLHYETKYNSDPLNKPDLDEVQRSELLFNRIFPLPKLPDANDLKAGSYMTVYFDTIQKADSIYFKDSTIIFNVFSHLEQWRMPLKLRPYSLMNEVDKLFNNQKIVGIGKVQFHRSDFLWVNKDFAGYSLKYKVIDFS